MASPNPFNQMAVIIPLTMLGCARCGDSSDTDSSHSDSGTHSERVDADGDGFSVAEGDCDDSDVKVSPVAAELCDSVDNDCDEEADENIAFVFFDSQDLPTAYSSGNESTPEIIEIASDGRIEICGSAYVNLSIRGATVTVDGMSSDATLSGAKVGTTIKIDEEAFVTIRNVRVTDGLADTCLFVSTDPASVSGGAICCDSASIHLESVSIDGNFADYGGGGLFASECSVSLNFSNFHENDAVERGGAFVIIDGTADIDETTFTNNSAQSNGGAGFFGRRKNPAEDETYILSNSLVSSNTALYGGGLSVAGPAIVSCVADTSSSEPSGIVSNIATDSGGAVWLFPESLVESNGCDWGTDAAGNNNSSASDTIDFGSDELFETAPDFGDDEYFSCAYETCPIP